MLASELIQRLNELMSSFGDCEVYHEDWEYELPVSKVEIRMIKDEEGIEVIFLSTERT